MENPPVKILLVEDNAGDARLLREALAEVNRTRFHLTHIVRLDEALKRLEEDAFDVVLLDLSLPDASGIETVMRTHRAASEVPIVVLTGFNDELFAAEAVFQGAQDYLVKGQISSALLERSIRYAIERCRAEKALRQREKRFRALIENSSDAIALVDAQGTYLYAGPSTGRVLGYASEELVGKNVAEFVHPDDRAHLLGIFNRLVQAPGTGLSVQFRNQHKDGSWRWLEVYGNNLIEEPAVAAVVCNFRDITGRKRAELEIEKQAAFAKFNPNPVMEFAADGALAYFNEAAQRMMSSLGKNQLTDVLPPDAASIVQECLAAGKTRSGLHTQISGRTIAWSFYPHPDDPDGSCVRVRYH